MSNVHLVFIEDGYGDLIDIEHYHHSCAPTKANPWPNPEPSDYPIFCVECLERIETIPLTSEGLKEYPEFVPIG